MKIYLRLLFIEVFEFPLQQYFWMAVFYFEQVNVMIWNIPTKARRCVCVQRAVLFEPSFASFPILLLCFTCFLPVLQCQGTVWVVFFCLAFSVLNAIPISPFRVNSQSKKFKICPYTQRSVYHCYGPVLKIVRNASAWIKGQTRLYAKLHGMDFIKW